MSKFADSVTIRIKAGDGGNGKISFRHEKYKAKGGPDGGDGGHGGNLVVKADPGLNTLAYFLSHKEVKAEDGKGGDKERRTGKSGEDEVIYVPLGTLIFGEKKDDKLAEILDQNDSFVLAKGGRGGFGNAHFKGSVRQAPNMAELGEPGEDKLIRLELKLIADIGLVGLPNAGKSTLISVISASRPKIADYHFTTLVPNLGVVTHKGESFVVADIPGLIEGASAGKGLGHDFLRHVERTKALVHLIDANSPNYLKDFETINTELKNYSSKLAEKPQIVAISKIDSVQRTVLAGIKKELSSNKLDSEIIFFSALTKEGLDELLDKMIYLAKQPVPEEEQAEELTVWTKEQIPEYFEIKKKTLRRAQGVKNFYIVSGKEVESLALRTDMNNSEALARLMRQLNKKGVLKALKNAGAKYGDRIRIAGKSFSFLDL